ncbi:DNA polymerase III subunit delta, partial [Staphylococcus devriesei]
MRNNVVAVYGEVPELVEKKSNELVNDFLEEGKDDFNFIKFNLYETNISSIIEEALTLPFISEKKAIVVKNSFMFTGEKVSKEITPNTDQVIEFLEKYDGNNLLIFEIYQSKLDERKKLTKTLKNTSKLYKVEQMSEQEMKSWIQNKLHENYKDIKQDALNLFIELTGINFNVISQELDK